MLLAAGWTMHAVSAIPYKLLELVTAVFTKVFKDGHNPLH
jgi:hypothetical protein